MTGADTTLPASAPVASPRLDGWLIVDKPLGLTSSGVVGRLRRRSGASKLGHGGTLDPLATGVLPLAFGEATKTVGWAMTGRKTYRMRIAWGEERTTDDREGAVTETSPERPAAAAIQAALGAFEGDILQTPPVFSAIKIGGKRAYALARADAPPVMVPRPARIDRIRLVDLPDPDHADLEVDCGKGVYMRALARDLARALGTRGHVAALRRLRVGPFGLESAISLDEAVDLCHKTALRAHLLPGATALDDIPALALTEAEAERLRHGQSVLPSLAGERQRLEALGDGTVVSALEGRRLVAVAECRGGILRPVRVMNL